MCEKKNFNERQLSSEEADTADDTNKTSPFVPVNHQESLDACKQRLCNGNEVAANFDPNGGYCNSKAGCQSGLKIVSYGFFHQVLYEIPEYQNQ